jgi:hypothetical protein
MISRIFKLSSPDPTVPLILVLVIRRDADKLAEIRKCSGCNEQQG